MFTIPIAADSVWQNRRHPGLRVRVLAFNGSSLTFETIEHPTDSRQVGRRHAAFAEDFLRRHLPIEQAGTVAA